MKTLHSPRCGLALAPACNWTAVRRSRPTRAWARSTEKPDGVKSSDYGVAIVGATTPVDTSGGTLAVLVDRRRQLLDARATTPGGKHQNLGDSEHARPAHDRLADRERRSCRLDGAGIDRARREQRSMPARSSVVTGNASGLHRSTPTVADSAHPIATAFANGELDHRRRRAAPACRTCSASTAHRGRQLHADRQRRRMPRSPSPRSRSTAPNAVGRGAKTGDVLRLRPARRSTPAGDVHDTVAGRRSPVATAFAPAHGRADPHRRRSPASSRIAIVVDHADGDDRRGPGRASTSHAGRAVGIAARRRRAAQRGVRDARRRRAYVVLGYPNRSGSTTRRAPAQVDLTRSRLDDRRARRARRRRRSTTRSPRPSQLFGRAVDDDAATTASRSSSPPRANVVLQLLPRPTLYDDTRSSS